MHILVSMSIPLIICFQLSTIFAMHVDTVIENTAPEEQVLEMEADFFRARKFLIGKGCIRDEKAAYRYFLAVADGEDSVVRFLAHVYLGCMNCFGVGVDKREQKGSEWFANAQEIASRLSVGSQVDGIINFFLKGGDALGMFASKMAFEKRSGQLLIEVARSGEVLLVQLLLDFAADVNTQQWGGLAPLHSASEKNRCRVVEVLLERGALVSLVDGDGKTALHYAAQSGSREAVELLLKHGIERDAIDKLGFTAFYRAVTKGHDLVVEALIDDGIDCRTLVFIDAQNPLHWVAPYGHEKVAALLIKKGRVAVDSVDCKKNSPLHLAVQAKKCALLQLLLEHKADVKARNEDKRTPLDQAISCMNFDAAFTLVRYGADLRFADAYGRSLLHYAVRECREEYIDILLEKKFDVDLPDYKGNAAIILAMKHGNLDGVGKLLVLMKSINNKNKKGMTPLHYAARLNRSDFIELLLAKGADKAIKDSAGKVPLDYATDKASIRFLC